MLKKRLLVLVMLLCLLGVTATQSVNADAYCSCAMTCGAGGKGGATCEASCSGSSLGDVLAAYAQCCQGAQEATGPMDCPASSPTVTAQ